MVHKFSKMRVLIIFIIFSMLMNFIVNNCAAKNKIDKEKILYIPLDSRPIVNSRTIEILEKAGCQIIAPPEELLGDRNNLGKPNLLWDWLNKNTTKNINAIVVSSDALLYGSLVGSRKHDYDIDEIFSRAEFFKEFHERHKNLPIYVFGSVMRTPRSGLASGYEEPKYYRYYGSDIFRLCELLDKIDETQLTQREIKEINFLQRLIPKEVMEDWLKRRERNFVVDKKLIDYARDRTFEYFLLGRDDSAPYSQTHYEYKKLSEYNNSFEKNNCQTIAGIDEFGLLLLTRALNDLRHKSPKIFVKYNHGLGANTIPNYSDEIISKSINSEIIAVGASLSENEKTADLILVVNTRYDGQIFEADISHNNSNVYSDTKYLIDTIENYINNNKKVMVADIAFANGSDNALMEQLKRRGLLFKLQAYGGWNTATNSSGYAISTGILSEYMSRQNIHELLLRRYLDDWAYQANVRRIVAEQLNWFLGTGKYEALDEKFYVASDSCESLLRDFAKRNLPNFIDNDKFKVDFPWNRMFEIDILLQK